MDIIKTQTDYFVLDAKLANPSPDRRTSHDWTKAEHYAAGIYKVVEETCEEDFGDTPHRLNKFRTRSVTVVGTLLGESRRGYPSLRDGGDTLGEFELLLHNLRPLQAGDPKPVYIRTLLDQHSLEDHNLLEILGRVMVAAEFPLGKLDAIMSDYLQELIEADKEVN